VIEFWFLRLFCNACVSIFPTGDFFSCRPESTRGLALGTGEMARGIRVVALLSYFVVFLTGE
jgi:hypothetical protein